MGGECTQRQWHAVIDAVLIHCDEVSSEAVDAGWFEA